MKSQPGKPAAADEVVVGLVDQAVAGDAEAFGALYDIYLGPIYRYLYFRLRDRTETEDLCEHVFLKAWESIGRYRWQGKPFVAWLYRLAHNALVDFLRIRRPTVSLDGQPGLLSVDSEPLLHEGLPAEELGQAIAQLTADQQQVIVLKFFQGLDTSEISATMHKREGAIRALQVRALASLRRIMQADNPVLADRSERAI